MVAGRALRGALSLYFSSIASDPFSYQSRWALFRAGFFLFCFVFVFLSRIPTNNLPHASDFSYDVYEGFLSSPSPVRAIYHRKPGTAFSPAVLSSRLFLAIANSRLNIPKLGSRPLHGSALSRTELSA